MFSGSGAIGIEALSRGAKEAVLVEKDREALSCIRMNLKATRFEKEAQVKEGDVLTVLRTLQHPPFDLIFLDPPYAQSLVPQALFELVEHQMLAKGAKLICETASPDDVFGVDQGLSEHFEILKQTRYGIAHVTILQYLGDGGKELV